MRTKTHIQLALIFFILTTALACRKGDGPGGGGGNRSGLAGSIYYEFADDGVAKLAMPSMERSLLMADKSKRNGWDISYDNTLKLEAETILHNHDDISFTLSRISDGSIVSQFMYSPLKGGSQYQSGALSPDGKMIMIPPSFDEGIVLLTTEGKLVGHIEAINGKPLQRLSSVYWLPNNGILLAHEKYIIRLDPPYTSGKLIKEMNYTTWGDLAVSRDGSKVAVVIDKHIHLMNIDGSDLVQVTESNFAEANPEFSPDGKHLLVLSDYHIAGVFSYYGYLKIIPADGKMYNVDPVADNSPGVIPVTLDGEKKPEAADGRQRWR